MASGQSVTSGDAARKRLGAWYTPADLVDLVVSRTIDAGWVAGRDVRVLDPACGDGRFLAAAVRRVTECGGRAVPVGVDVDAGALAAAAAVVPGAELRHADALALDWGDRRFDVVVGNPPFLSQLAAATTRGGASRHGGGPYMDVAAEFLALAVRLAAPERGRVGLVLPQSILASRDATEVRAAVDRDATESWTWWSPRRHFDADVVVCALGFERRPPADDPGRARGAWSHVVTRQLGVPDVPSLATVGTLGDRCDLNLNFRDEYYGLVGAVGDDVDGPPLVTSGSIDPGRSLWGERPVRFAKRRFDAPRVDLDRLDARMRAWAARKLVPKVLVANQTRVVEAVADPDGAWLPGVPVTTVVPRPETAASVVRAVWEVAAVLTAPVASATVWHRSAGTGLSGSAVRTGPALLGAVPWPAGPLDEAIAHLHAGDIEGCGRAVLDAYDVRDEPAASLLAWWAAALSDAPAPRRAPAPSRASRRSSTGAAGRPAR